MQILNIYHAMGSVAGKPALKPRQATIDITTLWIIIDIYICESKRQI